MHSSFVTGHRDCDLTGLWAKLALGHPWSKMRMKRRLLPQCAAQGSLVLHKFRTLEVELGKSIWPKCDDAVPGIRRNLVAQGDHVAED